MPEYMAYTCGLFSLKADSAQISQFRRILGIELRTTSIDKVTALARLFAVSEAVPIIHCPPCRD